MQIKYVEAYCLDDFHTELKIETDSEPMVPYQLYRTCAKDRLTKERTFLLESDQKNLVFEFEHTKDRRDYFIIEFPGMKPLLFGHRILPVPGMYNLRDIGGYLTESGKRIKWGVGFRSDYFTFLEDAGIPYMKSLGIKSIVDFRSEEEIKGSPDRVFDSNISTYIFDPNARTAAEAGKLHNNDQMDQMERLIARAAREVRNHPDAGDRAMIKQQLNFIDTRESVEAFRKMLMLLAQTSANPSVQHCRGGKDRTGFSLMLLEGVLGVPKELLVYDYMLTYKAREKKNKAYYQRYVEMTGDEKIAAYLYSFFDTKPEYIEASINKIMQEYGSIENYVREALAIDREVIGYLKDIFLEDQEDERKLEIKIITS